MTAYVDDMLRKAHVGRGRPARWSHLFADNPSELAKLARVLRLRPEWLQHAGTHREHYDVTATVRERAISLGAGQIDYPRGTAALMTARRTVCACTTLDTCQWGALVTAKDAAEAR